MKKRIITLFIVLMASFIIFALPAYASNTVDYQIYGTYDYDAVQEEIKMLNDLRADYGLAPLTLDPTLTEMAMQRAAECSVYYSHTRPNGTAYNTVIKANPTYNRGWYGENIAAGYYNASSVMTGWTNSQGHFENMISVPANYKSVGLGCFYQDNGDKYWVQLFHTNTCSSPCKTTGKINKSNININVAVENLNLYYPGGGGCNVNIYEGVTSRPVLYVKNTGFPYGTAINLSGGYYLESTDPSLAKASGFTVTGVKAGDTTIKVVFNTGYINVKYTVLAKPKLTHQVNSSGEVLLHLDGKLDTTTNNVQVYFKESNDEYWTQTNINDVNKDYSIYTSEYGDIYTCVVRYWDEYYNKWIEVSDRLTAKVKLKQPKISLTTVSSSGKPKLTWDQVEGASKYEVWRKVGSNGTYKKYYTTKGTSMTNTSATAGTTYYYKIKAICDRNPACNSSFSTAKYVTCDLAKPVTKLTIVSSSGKPKLTWDKVEGASKYEVWRKVGSNGNYSKYYTTTKTSMTNTSAKVGTKYYYKVKAICNKNSAGNSKFSNAQYIICDLSQPVTKLTTVASTGKPKLTWNAVDGASKYEVWRKVGSNGTYEKYYTTKGTSMTNTSATAEKTYYYKVKAIHASKSAANSAFSASKYITCDLAKPKVSITLKDGKPKVSWSNVSGADKYEVWRKVGSSGSYTKFYTTTKRSVINTSAKKGKTYYYKVKAISTKTSAANSAFSSVVYKTSK